MTDAECDSRYPGFESSIYTLGSISQYLVNTINMWVFITGTYICIAFPMTPQSYVIWLPYTASKWQRSCLVMLYHMTFFLFLAPPAWNRALDYWSDLGCLFSILSIKMRQYKPELRSTLSFLCLLFPHRCKPGFKWLMAFQWQGQLRENHLISAKQAFHKETPK